MKKYSPSSLTLFMVMRVGPAGRVLDATLGRERLAVLNTAQFSNHTQYGK